MYILIFLPTLNPLNSELLLPMLLMEKEMAMHSVLLPGKSHGQRSLVGYSLWGRKESDITEQLHFHTFMLLMKGEINAQGSLVTYPRSRSC